MIFTQEDLRQARRDGRKEAAEAASDILTRRYLSLDENNFHDAEWARKQTLSYANNEVRNALLHGSENPGAVRYSTPEYLEGKEPLPEPSRVGAMILKLVSAQHPEGFDHEGKIARCRKTREEISFRFWYDAEVFAQAINTYLERNRS